MGYPAPTPSNPQSNPVSHDKDRLHLHLRKLANDQQVLQKLQQRGSMTYTASAGPTAVTFSEAFPTGASVFVTIAQKTATTSSIRTEITAISETGFTYDVAPTALGGSASVDLEYIAVASA